MFLLEKTRKYHVYVVTTSFTLPLLRFSSSATTVPLIVDLNMPRRRLVYVDDVLITGAAITVCCRGVNSVEAGCVCNCNCDCFLISSIGNSFCVVLIDCEPNVSCEPIVVCAVAVAATSCSCCRSEHCCFACCWRGKKQFVVDVWLKGLYGPAAVINGLDGRIWREFPLPLGISDGIGGGGREL